ncbi:hypothetical protein [Streptomyces sp. DSM 40750]|uniref:hypothetical protein n=1 Tax=Streptomyces sp. DSM 40750 TaxID=2801030 RepID=UPI00214B7DAC|nr:hypothetical protein [Streptomyces sp. DSM 40750]UUU22194.1 hypothetical protein JIX55_18810 [Streptomyces sp. DSM 40750]
MKSLKAAAVVTGSLIIAGAAAPAFAQGATDVVHKSLNNAAKALNTGPVQVQPLKGSDALDVKEKKESLLSAVDRTSTSLGDGTLLGGLPHKK